NAGNPTVFVRAETLGLSGTETQAQVNGDGPLLARLEALRAAGAVAMGLAATAAQAKAERPHTPKLCLIAPPQTYRVAGGKQVQAEELDVI
ncbi:unnamed protein product, partial [Alternaria burnsii]